MHKAARSDRLFPERVHAPLHIQNGHNHHRAANYKSPVPKDG
eukprot:CAMPEP_0183568978 /NCGR_PEP_ID=MMETSP0371-20130417/118928_1 /TAXON_ID=268820 /ORGANISM="Peridinium aciculiferum, Strain PAER-2" /LENGTH=41 /DNA_ID= /DNA_START= /DNA_END= /DNA_ORIENTATION=